MNDIQGEPAKKKLNVNRELQQPPVKLFPAHLHLDLMQPANMEQLRSIARHQMIARANERIKMRIEGAPPAERGADYGEPKANNDQLSQYQRMSDIQGEPAKKKLRTEQVQAEVRNDAVASAKCAQKQSKAQKVPSARLQQPPTKGQHQCNHSSDVPLQAASVFYEKNIKMLQHSVKSFPSTYTDAMQAVNIWELHKIAQSEYIAERVQQGKMRIAAVLRQSQSACSSDMPSPLHEPQMSQSQDKGNKNEQDEELRQPLVGLLPAHLHLDLMQPANKEQLRNIAQHQMIARANERIKMRIEGAPPAERGADYGEPKAKNDQLSHYQRMNDTQGEPEKRKLQTEQVQAKVQTEAVASAMCAQKQPTVQVPPAQDNQGNQYQTRTETACTKEKE